jgi:hypothetical protein
MLKKGRLKLLLMIPLTVALVLGIWGFLSGAPAMAGKGRQAKAGNVPAFDKLDFFEQDSFGRINQQGAKGHLKYTTAGPSFQFNFEGVGLASKTDYSLIRSREPGITLPYRFDVIGEETSDSQGNLNFSGSYAFNMTLISAQILMVPTQVIGPQQPDGAYSLATLTTFPKSLFGQGAISYTYTGATVQLQAGSDQRPQVSSWDVLGPKVNDPAIDFTLMGIDPTQPLATGNAAQALTKYKLSELCAAKPVVLVFGAYT